MHRAGRGLGDDRDEQCEFRQGTSNSSYVDWSARYLSRPFRRGSSCVDVLFDLDVLIQYTLQKIKDAEHGDDVGLQYC